VGWLCGALGLVCLLLQYHILTRIIKIQTGWVGDKRWGMEVGKVLYHAKCHHIRIPYTAQFSCALHLNVLPCVDSGLSSQPMDTPLHWTSHPVESLQLWTKLNSCSFLQILAKLQNYRPSEGWKSHFALEMVGVTFEIGSNVFSAGLRKHRTGRDSHWCDCYAGYGVLCSVPLMVTSNGVACYQR
jgi:hypothetical protein